MNAEHYTLLKISHVIFSDKDAYNDTQQPSETVSLCTIRQYTALFFRELCSPAVCLPT